MLSYNISLSCMYKRILGIEELITVTQIIVIYTVLQRCNCIQLLILYICDFHREQAYEQWTRGHKHGYQKCNLHVPITFQTSGLLMGLCLYVRLTGLFLTLKSHGYPEGVQSVSVPASLEIMNQTIMIPLHTYIQVSVDPLQVCCNQKSSYSLTILNFMALYYDVQFG